MSSTQESRGETAGTTWWRNAEIIRAITSAAGGFLGCYVWATTGGLGGLAYGLFLTLVVVYMSHAFTEHLTSD